MKEYLPRDWETRLRDRTIGPRTEADAGRHVSGHRCRTLESYLEDSIMNGVCHDAQMDVGWQAETLDENSDVRFGEIHDCFVKADIPSFWGL